MICSAALRTAYLFTGNLCLACFDPEAIGEASEDRKENGRFAGGGRSEYDQFPGQRKQIQVGKLRILRKETICAKFQAAQSRLLNSLANLSVRPVTHLECPWRTVPESASDLPEQIVETECIRQLHQTDSFRLQDTPDLPEESQNLLAVEMLQDAVGKKKIDASEAKRQLIRASAEKIGRHTELACHPSARLQRVEVHIDADRPEAGASRCDGPASPRATDVHQHFSLTVFPQRPVRNRIEAQPAARPPIEIPVCIYQPMVNEWINRLAAIRERSRCHVPRKRFSAHVLGEYRNAPLHCKLMPLLTLQGVHLRMHCRAILGARENFQESGIA